MLKKLLYAYEDKCLGKKTLIFNNGINTSLNVYDTFKQAGHPIKHLDNKNSTTERQEILEWFKKTPNAILTSVSILTTGKNTSPILTSIPTSCKVTIQLSKSCINAKRTKLAIAISAPAKPIPTAVFFLAICS